MREITLDACDQYAAQDDLFVLAALNDIPVPTPLEDALATMRTIEAILQSAKSGQWIAC